MGTIGQWYSFYYFKCTCIDNIDSVVVFVGEVVVSPVSMDCGAMIMREIGDIADLLHSAGVKNIDIVPGRISLQDSYWAIGDWPVHEV